MGGFSVFACSALSFGCLWRELHPNGWIAVQLLGRSSAIAPSSLGLTDAVDPGALGGGDARLYHALRSERENAALSVTFPCSWTDYALRNFSDRIARKCRLVSFKWRILDHSNTTGTRERTSAKRCTCDEERKRETCYFHGLSKKKPRVCGHYMANSALLICADRN